MSRIKKPRCPACNHRDCKGWQPGDPEHEYRGKGSWFLGCHCAGCSRARDESGGFMGALADALRPTASCEEGEGVMAHLTSTDMNDALIAFNSRWSLDGDYLRCTECKRPQIASKADQAFVHQADCTKPHADHTHPWHDLRNLLRGLPEKPRQGEEGEV